MFEEIKNRSTNCSVRRQAPVDCRRMFFDIPDTHSVAIVASHYGRPIRSIEVRKYQVFDQSPQVNGSH